MVDNREWFVWHLFKGGVETASIAETKKFKHNTSARLGEPYDTNLGWFDLDRLEKHGYVETSGYIILSPAQWELQREALYEKLSKTKSSVWPSNPDMEHRTILNLPRRGPLYRSEIL